MKQVLEATGLFVVFLASIMLWSPKHIEAAPPNVRYCDGLPQQIGDWFKAHNESLFKRVTEAAPPNSAFICYNSSKDRIIFVVYYDFQSDLLSVSKSQGNFASDIFIYDPNLDLIILRMDTPTTFIHYLNLAMWAEGANTPGANFWQSTNYYVSITKNTGEYLTAGVSTGRTPALNGYLEVSVKGYDPQIFMGQQYGSYVKFTNRKTLAGKMTQEGLVYSFLQLDKTKEKK